MAQAGVSIQLSIPEIYQQLCKKCQKKLKRLIAEKVTEEMVRPIVEPKPTRQA
jgi:hypothetical protein